MFGYLRPMEGDASIGVILNYSAKDLDAVMTLPAQLTGVPLVDLWTGADIPQPPNDDALSLSVPAWECRILQARHAVTRTGEGDRSDDVQL
jgi:hypothetical protein